MSIHLNFTTKKKSGIYTALDSYIKVFDELGYKGVVVDEDLINTRLLKKYDVIQVNGPVGFRTLFKIWRSKVTAFLTLHGWVIQEPFNQLKIKKDLKSTLYFVYKVIYNLLNWIFHLILFIPLIYNNRVTAVSKITSKKNRVNAFVIPNALITDEIEGKVRECPELHWDCITAVTYISGGGSKVLSIQRLAEIISEVNRKAGCRIRLLVFGESPEIEDDCIEFMGYRDDFLCHVKSADIMLLGYDMSELGYAVLEAGYLGVPVAKFRGEFFRDTIASLTKFFVMDYRGGTVTTAFGVGVKYVSQFVRIISYYLSLGFIAIGIVDALRKRYSEHLNANLICLSFVGLFILFLSVVLPYVTKGYDVERLFYHILICTAIFFVFGGEFIAEKFFRVFNRGSLVQWRVLILSSVLFLQFIAGTSLVYSLGDAPGRAFPEFSEKTVLDAGTVYKSDVYSALWVLHFGDEKKVVLFDNIGDHKFLFSVCSFGKGFSTGNFKMSFFTEEIFTAKKFRILNYTSPSGINNYYGYLSRYNVLNKKIILDSSLENDTLLNTINRIAKSNVIYDNGYSKILSK